MKNTPLFVFVGASASGKSTICKTLCKFLDMHEAVSMTTRDRRPHEQHGVDYYFVNQGEFDAANLVESITYAGNHYGVTALELDSSDLVVAEPTGAKAIKDYCALTARLCYVIAIRTPEMERLLRMVERGDSVTAIKRRVENDKDTFSDVILSDLADCIIEDTDRLTTTMTVVSYIWNKWNKWCERHPQ